MLQREKRCRTCPRNFFEREKIKENGASRLNILFSLCFRIYHQGEKERQAVLPSARQHHCARLLHAFRKWDVSHYYHGNPLIFNLSLRRSHVLHRCRPAAVPFGRDPAMAILLAAGRGTSYNLSDWAPIPFTGKAGGTFSPLPAPETGCCQCQCHRDAADVNTLISPRLQFNSVRSMLNKLVRLPLLGNGKTQLILVSLSLHCLERLRLSAIIIAPQRISWQEYLPCQNDFFTDSSLLHGVLAWFGTIKYVISCFLR